MAKLNLKTSVFILVSLMLSSCNYNKQEKFDKAKWNKHEDAGQPSIFRNKMLNDLTTNYKLIGFRYMALVELLGEPNFKDSNSLGYDIIVEYGNDIDPIYTKTLRFTFSRDSIIKSFKVNEWKK